MFNLIVSDLSMFSCINYIHKIKLIIILIKFFKVCNRKDGCTSHFFSMYDKTLQKISNTGNPKSFSRVASS